MVPMTKRTQTAPSESSSSAGDSNRQIIIETFFKSEDESSSSSSENEPLFRRLIRGSKRSADENNYSMRPRLMKRLSKRLSHEFLRRRSSAIESLPDTPAGWTILITALSSLFLGYELNLQRSLTMPPTVYCQAHDNPKLDAIYKHLTATPTSILRRPIQPSLIVGTRSVLASTVAYIATGPGAAAKKICHFHEIVTMPLDGTLIALDWEFQVSQQHNDNSTETATTTTTTTTTNTSILNDIVIPKSHVVLIYHGINNDATFGYIRSTMRACSDRGWAAVGVNFRGCGGVPLATPRMYTGAFTGDIRGVVQILCGRLEGTPFKLFLVGNSLGANLVTKYLGEEGRGMTLPKAVAGAVSLGNPLHIHAGHIKFPWGHILGLGARKGILEHFMVLRRMSSDFFQQRIRMALMAPTIGKFDEALAPIFIRNSPYPPFEPHIGYENAEEYWNDASSYRCIPHVSVPFLQLSSEDDFLVSSSSRQKLHYSLSNPNVMVVNTRCGGHLGWRESPPENKFGLGTSWADRATVDFINAVLEADRVDLSQASSSRRNALCGSAKRETGHLRSKL